MIGNCSSKEQCNWDGDCFGGQKCCVSTCETRSCHEPVQVIGPHEGTMRISSLKKKAYHFSADHWSDANPSSACFFES